MTIPRQSKTAEIGFFFGILLFLLFVGRVKLLQDPDTFWHIVVGQQILDTGEFVETDGFTFTFGGERWIANQWLGECLLAVIHGAAGFDGLLLFTATILAWLYAWVGSRLVRGGLHWLVALLVVALVLVSSSANFQARPHISTILLLSATFAMLAGVERRTVGLAQLWWLVPIFTLWANIHGGVMAGIGTLGLAVGGWTGLWLLGAESPVQNFRQVSSLFLLIGACLLCTLINPYGLGMLRAWHAIMGADLPNLVIEHARLDPSSGNPGSGRGRFILVCGVGYVLLLVSTLPRAPRISWLLPLVWFCMAVMRMRHAPLFAVTAALALPELIPNSRCADWLRRREFLSDPEPSEEVSSRAALIRSVLFPAALVLGLMLVLWSGFLPVGNGGFAKPDPKIWPAELLPELRRFERQHPPGTPIFNEQEFGGFLIYHTRRLRVFIDGRCELFGDQFLYQYIAARDEDPKVLGRWAKQYGFEAALVKAGSSFDRYLDDQLTWNVIAQTPTAKFYTQRDAPNNSQ